MERWHGKSETCNRSNMDSDFIYNSKNVVFENEPVLYYLDGEYAPSRGFVCEELMYVDPEKIQYPPQRILLENQHSRLVHTAEFLAQSAGKINQGGGIC